VFVNIGEFLTSFDRFDLIVVLFLFGMFVLGFAQGTIRRLLGIASMLFSFLFAANLREPLGSFLAANWNQFPDEYAVMIGFGAVFTAATIAFTLILQGFYHRQPLFEKATVVDEILGGILGIIQGIFFLGCVLVILDSFFLNPLIVPDPQELPFLRDLHGFITGSQTAEILRSTLIPAFYAVLGFFVPASLRAFHVVVN
jgi:uncharacterized membrane protein required for colicin V production